MPRKQLLRVRDFPVLRPNRWYRVCVAGVEVTERKALSITLTHEDSEQNGRTRVLLLALPIRPAGLAARFFQAAGQEVRVDHDLDPRALVGALLRVQFGKRASGELDEVVDFAPVEAKGDHAAPLP